MKSKSQSGVALVITLILLAVITFMAVTFLVVSRREGGAVENTQNQAAAKNAMDSALQQALAEIIAQEQATTNGLNGGLRVSTNFVSRFFDTTGVVAAITNVNYLDQNGAPLTGNNLQRMLNNLLILPRAPVFVSSNRNQTTPPEFRYWHDLNRNGVYDTNGAVVEVDGNGNPVTNFYVGDPEWIGILNHPELRHSASNFFLGRFCYIALPIGNSEDINYIHNQAKLLSSVWDNGFLRNQGVGSWEINMGGFLHEVNTNWDQLQGRAGYGYSTANNVDSPGIPAPSSGPSFDDATAILQFRLNNTYNSLRTFRNLYGNIAGGTYANDFIDGSCFGPLMTNLGPLTVDKDGIVNSKPWVGDFSTNQYFSTQDLFTLVPHNPSNPTNTFLDFSDHLVSLGRSYTSLINSAKDSITNSYNRYTFYRMLSQLSFGSASEPAQFPYVTSANSNYANVYSNLPRMNLNYVNVNGTNATNFQAWAPVQFFTNAADRMLRAYFPNPIGITNGKPAYLSLNYIPVYPTNYYTPSVHRILQLAANIYDSNNTNRFYDQLTPNGPYFPSVFKPYFAARAVPGTGTNIVYIAGYVEVGTNLSPRDIDERFPIDFRRAADLNKFLGLNATPSNPGFINVYGVPYVIGAKTGFPSFNKFASCPIVEISRKLEVVKPQGPGSSPTTWLTNALYVLTVSNAVAMECWYPSANQSYARTVNIVASDECDMFVTNNVGAPTRQPVPSSPTAPQTVVAGANVTYNQLTWSGSPRMSPGSTANISPSSFRDPMFTNVVACSNAVMLISPPRLIDATALPAGTSIGFQNTPPYFSPRFGVNVTNRVRMMMIDSKTGRLIDCVFLGGLGTLGGPDFSRDVTQDLVLLETNVAAAYRFWEPSAATNLPAPGFQRQVIASASGVVPPPSVWTAAPLPPGQSVPQEMSAFASFLLPNSQVSSMQVPLMAYGHYQVQYIWSANDPLVHYTLGDLTDLTQSNSPMVFQNGNPLTNSFGLVNGQRYQPWGINSTVSGLADMRANPLAYKDPLISMHDSWQFPTNKFPNIGWLGRVHRGTPWQTVYLKSAAINTNDWVSWTGNLLTNYYTGNDPFISRPSSDWILMDLFTTAPNENASKGQLSINQTNSAAWAAILDGVLTVTNGATNIGPHKIDPFDSVPVNGFNTNTIQYLVNSINSTRTNFPGGVFSSLGQICSVPQLTVNSPYVNSNFPNTLSDAAYERIPQQVMSLLRLGSPRYVIFIYGQALKPAEHSIVQSGQFFGMCTNYQITGESAARVVVRIDNFPVPGQPATQPRAVVESFTMLGPDQ